MVLSWWKQLVNIKYRITYPAFVLFDVWADQLHWLDKCLLYTVIERNTVKPVLRGHLGDIEKVALSNRWPLKRGLIYMKCSMMGQEKDDLYKTGDCLIEVTTWRGLTVHWNIVQFLNNIIMIKLRFSLLMHMLL